MPAVTVSKILLPRDADMEKWAVIACDQYTSDELYWSSVERKVAGARSTYDLIFPEIYLGKDEDARIEKIGRNMEEYLSSGVFCERECLVQVRRHTSSGERMGIVAAVDLEEYSYSGGKSRIRPTEATIPERIPPRVKIRDGGKIELPHAMLLYDDPEDSVQKSVAAGETLYDFDLMMGGGRIEGRAVENPEEVLEALFSTEKDGLLLAVGDGNHSVAAAKACWEEAKKSLPESVWESCPLRYCLCEMVNIYDPALKFEPINRFIKTARSDDFVRAIAGLNLSGPNACFLVQNGTMIPMPFPEDVPEGIAALDARIKEKLRGGETVDYVHGEDQIVRLSGEGLGIILPKIDKGSFFDDVRERVFPRKTFSMGEGSDKRYYIESRRIKEE